MRHIDYDAISFKTKREAQKNADWHSFFELGKETNIFDLEEQEIPGTKKQVQVTFNLHQQITDNPTYLLIQPLQVVRILENPFKENKRNYPV